MMIKLTQSSEKFYNILLVVITCNLVYGQNNYPPNPCPKYFSYIVDRSSIIGNIQLNPPQINESFQLEVSVSVAALLPSEYVGEIVLPGSKDQHYQQVLHGLPLNYKVLFPSDIPLPLITRIKVNGLEICNGPPDQGTHVTSINLMHNLRTSQWYKYTTTKLNVVNAVPFNDQSTHITSVRPIEGGPFSRQKIPTQSPPHTPYWYPPKSFPQSTENVPTQQPPKKPTRLPQFAQQINSCGIPTVKLQPDLPLIKGGSEIERGTWPWLAAIREYTLQNEIFICGGSLVSPIAVVTATHCVIRNGGVISHDVLIVELGRHNLYLSNEDGMERLGVQEIVPHPDFKLDMGYDADVAVLILQGKLEYTNFIRPICLPTMTRNMVGFKGTVAGWGRTENRDLSPVPLQINEQPIASQSECVKSNETFKQLVSLRTFCAGTRSGSGPCVGDSGGGFGIIIDGRWTLYGSVSAALRGIDFECDLNNFIIYCNISEFLNWLLKYI